MKTRSLAASLARGSAWLLTAALAGCGGGGGSSTGSQTGGGTGTPAGSGNTPAPVPGTPPPAPATPPPSISTPAPTPTTPLTLASLELAQTHVVGANGRQMQSTKDMADGVIRRLDLFADRPALLMTEPGNGAPRLQVRARLANGNLLGPLALNPPSALPATDGARAPYSSVKHSVVLPTPWIQPGTILELSQDAFASTPVGVALTVLPRSRLELYTMPIYLWGARPERSVIPDFQLSSLETNGYRLNLEYEEKLPLSDFSQQVGAAIILDQLPVPARNDSVACHPALSFSSYASAKAAAVDTHSQLMRWVEALRSPTGSSDNLFETAYYGYTQVVDDKGRQIPNPGTAYGSMGGGYAVSGTDWAPANLYSAVFNHELGHAFGLPHADAVAAEGRYPYPFGRKSGSSWGYDANRNELLSPLQVPGRSCGTQLVDNLCYQASPMAGGEDDRIAAAYRWTMFSDYEIAQIQAWLLGKYVADAGSAGGFRKWNSSTGQFEPMVTGDRRRVGADVLKRGQQVITVMGSVSHHNLSPTASRLFVGQPWINNLPRHYDPTVQADLDLMLAVNAPGGSDDYYCLSNGCDYTLVATYGDNTIVRVLLPVGYRVWYGKMAIDAATQDVMNPKNLARYAVNLPAGHGGIARVQVFSTPFGATWRDTSTRKAINPASLGTSAYPLVNEWIAGNGSSGGAGAAGNTTFNAGVCKPGAKVIAPPR